MALKLYTSPNSNVQVYATDYKMLIRELNKIDPEQSKQLKRRFKEIAKPAKESVVKELKDLGTPGPLRGMRHGGRTGWGTNYGSTGGPVGDAKRVPYNSVFIDAFNRPKKGQTGIARLRVRSAGTVLTDLARKLSGKAYTRPYRIREFGGPEVTRTHEIRPYAVGVMIRQLGAVKKRSKRNKSRNVYPGFDKAAPQAAKQAEVAIKETIKFVEKNIDRNNR
jgi:hypothetical protein